jgi:hypothetical protein
MTDEELDALVQELLGKQVCTGFEQTEPYTIDCVYGPDPICQGAATAITTLRADLTAEREKSKALMEALHLARPHVANNAQGWSVGRAASRADLTAIDAALAAYKSQSDGFATQKEEGE